MTVELRYRDGHTERFRVGRLVFTGRGHAGTMWTNTLEIYGESGAFNHYRNAQDIAEICSYESNPSQNVVKCIL
jgi:hypothetical protein